MTLLAAIAAKNHKPVVQVYIGGRPYKAITTTVDHGYDSISSAATVQIADLPAEGIDFRDDVEIWLGYDGWTTPAFKGFLEDHTKLYFPFVDEVRAAGFLKLAQYQYPGNVDYNNIDDEDLVIDLLDRAGVPQRQIDGESQQLGTVETITLRDGQATFDLINLVDQTLGYKTFDSPGGVVHRQAISGIPSVFAAFSYEEGVDILAISNPRTLRGLHNRVVVVGLPLDAFTVGSTRQSANSLVPDPPKYITFEFRSDLIETDAIAGTVATRIMKEVNRVITGFEIEVPGNPYLAPGMTVSVKAPTLGYSDFTPQWVRHVSHVLDETGFVTRLSLEGGEGPLGYEVNKKPIAVFTYRITGETFVAGLQYTVTCDGSASWDRDGPPSALSFSWSNDKNGDTGTDPTYSTAFTQAQLDSGPKITLSVTDGPGAVGSITQTIVGTAELILKREIYVAAGSRAEASPDGGATWNTWTPGAGTVVSTPEQAVAVAAGGVPAHSYFGLSNGELYKTMDLLATAPTLVHDFGSQINCIWINELNTARVVVGLSNGDIWLTVNAPADAAAVWTRLIRYLVGGAPQYIQESAANPGQFRVVVGNAIRITFDSFATEAVLIQFAGATHHLATSAFANYGCATEAQDVKREDGVEITGISSNDVRAVTHHIRDDILWALDDNAQSYKKAAGTTAFTTEGLFPGTPGTAHHMYRDGDNQLVIYGVADNGLYKTTDGAGTWAQVRDYSAGGLQGLQLGLGGFGALPVGPGLAIAAGRVGTAVKLAETHNLLSASPNWTEIGNTGLPSSPSAGVQFYRNPFNPNEQAVIIVPLSGPADEIWRTENLDAGASCTWTKVFDLAALNTLMSTSHTQLDISVYSPMLSYSIAKEDYFVFLCQAPNDNDAYIIHTHDHADSFDGYQISTNVILRSNILVGQWDHSRIWFVTQPPGFALRGQRSDDHGHSHFQMAFHGYGSSGETIYLLAPYASNEDQQTLYRIANSSSNTAKNTGGGDDSAWVDTGVDMDPNESQKAGWDLDSFYWAVGDTLKASLDDLVSESSSTGVADGPQDVLTMALLRPNLLMYAGQDLRVFTTEDWITVVERTGDLQLIFTSGEIDGLVPSLLGDW